MQALERAGYLARAQSTAFGRRVDGALAVIREGLSVCHRPFVSFSAGKDSTALLWLALQERADISARILTSGESRNMHADLDEVFEWWRTAYPSMELREVLVDRVWADEWASATWDEERKAGRGDIVRGLWGSGDFDGVLMGLRDDESNARRIANKRGLIRRYRDTRGDIAAGGWVICPLARWTTQDVATLIVSRGLPLLRAYDVGIDGMNERTTMRLTGDAVRQNAMVDLRMRDKGEYNRVVKRFEELQRWGG
jgi:sulfate adenylyltransferase subunit 2